MIAAAAWCTLFVRAPAGAAQGLLQRRWGNTPERRARLEDLGLLLSDAAPPAGWRALVAAGAGEDVRGWMEAAGPVFARAFPPAATLLWSDAAAWGFCVWPSEGAAERGGGAREAPKRPGLLSRLLLPAEPACPPEAAWALARGLPADRITALAGRRPPPILDWETVAGLAERGLLVENAPRFYRLRFR